MMVENHYDDEVLIAMLDGDAESVAADPHLAACEACRGILDNVRLMADALRDECVWDRQELSEEPVQATLDLLRTTAARMDAEDAEAERYLADLLAGPRESWMPRLEQHPEWRTPGVVRRLVWRADNEVHTMPLDSLEMAKMAVETVRSIPQPEYKLAASASRILAYVLFFTGSFAEALSWIDTADEQLFSQAGIADYDGARQTLVRALILDAQENTAAAAAATATSSSIFASFGDRKRWLYGTYVSAMIEYGRRNLRMAISLFEQIEQPMRELGDLLMLAGVYQNLAFCYSEERRFSQASLKFMQAMALLTDLGMSAETARLRWNMGVMQLHAGNYAVALQSLRVSEQELRSFGMLEDALRASLDVIEAQIALGQLDGAATTANRVLQDSQTPSLAATATAYLREIGRASEITAHEVRTIRSDIRQLRENPRLLFAPLPE